ncbi:hypothetical protein P7E30_05195 [Enterococcus gallinarum]|uniref:Uncharacterized protein n=1 Tax=Enterococcus gallinarum TaxID=1353 RepID=A0AAE4HRL8_ENTGA|nr:hypothetical protein [Enterococcus gallinarum]MDT2689609.1 hypothetical protein [Enterococcus gallinarum]
MSKENEELLNMGMGILKHADASKLESVNVDVTKRPDGSRRIAIKLVYPEEVEKKVDGFLYSALNTTAEERGKKISDLIRGASGL